MKPMNGTPNIATVTKSFDKSGDDKVGDFVRVVKEGEGGGEKGVREQDISDGDVTQMRMGVVVGVRFRAGSPIEEEEGMVGIGLVLNDLNN